MLLVAFGVTVVWRRAEVTRLYGVVTLFDESHIVQNFSDMNDLSFNASMPRGDGPATPLPQGPAYVLSAEALALGRGTIRDRFGDPERRPAAA